MAETGKTPLFSIVTVTLDNVGGLRNTYESLEKQSFRDFEWIVKDGYSQDGTLKYLETCRVDILITEPDKGIYDAMNKALDHVNGRYVIFLNAADALSKSNVLERIAEKLSDGAEFLYGDSFEKISGDHLKLKRARKHQKVRQGMFTHHQAMIYKTGILQKLKFNTDYRIAADYDLTLAYLKRCRNIVYLNFPVCIFEEGGVSQQRVGLGRAEQFHIRKQRKCCSILMNRLIFCLQFLNWQLRRFFPSVYWFLKRRI